MTTPNNSYEPLQKVYRSVAVKGELKKALTKHVKKHLTVEDAAIALGIKRKETLAYVIKNGSCHSSTYNKLLVLVNPALVQNTTVTP